MEKDEALKSVRPSARIKTVAKLLDCNQSQVRELVTSGALESHRIGKRGWRVFLDSVAAYQQQKEWTSPPARESVQKRRMFSRKQHSNALKALKEAGVL